MNDRIKIILVDDHAVVRAGFRMLLSTEDTIEVIAEAERGEEACQLYLEKQPDVMVMDLSMPGIGGLECIRRICNRDNHTKILVFSVHDERVYVDRTMNAGAKGLTAHKIADELCLGYKTVASYGTQIRSKLKVSSVAELAHIAIGLGVMKKTRLTRVFTFLWERL